MARLAGVPAAVLARAKAVLARLEQGRVATGGLAAGLGDLPLFAHEAPKNLVAEPGSDSLSTRLLGLDLDALSPRDALALLYELRRETETLL